MSECGIHVSNGNAQASNPSFLQQMCSTYRSTALDNTALLDLKRDDNFSIKHLFFKKKIKKIQTKKDRIYLKGVITCLRMHLSETTKVK